MAGPAPGPDVSGPQLCKRGVAAVQREFWLERWQNNEIGFHLADVNPRLRQYWPALGVPEGAGVFVPLCGKSLDLHWLAGQQHPVVGVELAEAAVRAFFAEAGLHPRLERDVRWSCYVHEALRIYCGDFMDLTARELRGVGGVYDRAALVALPPRMREHYVDHLLRIVPDGACILLVTFEYDQSRIPGPPHAVLEDEVNALYGARCDVELLAREQVRMIPPAFAAAGIDAAGEAVYRIVKRA